MTEQAPENFTEMPAPDLSDYAVDEAALLRGMGIDPATVEQNSLEVKFLNGKAVVFYKVIRAVPTRVLAFALLAGMPREPEQAPEHTTPEAEQPALPVAPVLPPAASAPQ